ncbi:MAG: hypothetical protein V4696_10670 [Pseudomonadota bacterium]
MRIAALAIGLAGISSLFLGLRLAYIGVLMLSTAPDLTGDAAFGDGMARSLFLSEAYARLQLSAILGIGGLIVVALASLIWIGDGGND